MIWQEYMQALADRMKQPDAAQTNVRLGADIPYNIKGELEHVLVMSLNQVLGEIPEPDWDSFSSLAVKVITGGSFVVEWSQLAIPLALRRVLAISVDGEPSVLSSVGTFIQFAGTSSRYSSQVALINGAICFRGTTITVTYLSEPTMDEWKQSPKSILPPGYDLRVLDIAFKRYLISEYAPEWGA